MSKPCLYIEVHPENPQPRLLAQAVERLEAGGIVAFPTESGYALGCLLDNKDGAERIRQLRRLDDKHDFTLMCPDLSHLSHYAKVGNVQFRYLKAHLPGPYTFILPASREVPRRIQNPKRKTIGLRVSPNQVCQTLLSYFDKPLMSVSLILPDDSMPMADAWSIKETLESQLDVIIDGGFGGYAPTTIIDFTDDVPKLVRLGQGVFDE
jgi:tRNA threonylcarbamoyl adenosine modification protein (Sua5/YciO/YrdC/YwlC family)